MGFHVRGQLPLENKPSPTLVAFMQLLHDTNWSAAPRAARGNGGFVEVCGAPALLRLVALLMFEEAVPAGETLFAAGASPRSRRPLQQKAGAAPTGLGGRSFPYLSVPILSAPWGGYTVPVFLQLLFIAVSVMRLQVLF